MLDCPTVGLLKNLAWILIYKIYKAFIQVNKFFSGPSKNE
jgi:hypothetical protein